MDARAPRVADCSSSRSFGAAFANPRNGLSRCRSAAWMKRKESIQSLYANLRTVQVRGNGGTDTEFRLQLFGCSLNSVSVPLFPRTDEFGKLGLVLRTDQAADFLAISKEDERG